MKEIILTTSWDDGDSLDLKLAELLGKYGIKGTFYIPKKYLDDPLSEADIVSLSGAFEIASHTLNHPELDNIPVDQAALEIRDSKEYLEKLIGREVRMFAYPRGRFNERIKKVVKEAGYLGARSTQAHSFDAPIDPYDFRVTLSLYPLPVKLAAMIFKEKGADRFFKKISRSVYCNFYQYKNNFPVGSIFSWKNLAIDYFNRVKRQGGVFHLCGHSREIERYGLWRDLELFLGYVSGVKNIKFLTNAETMEYFNDGRS